MFTHRLIAVCTATFITFAAFSMVRADEEPLLTVVIGDVRGLIGATESLGRAVRPDMPEGSFEEALATLYGDPEIFDSLAPGSGALLAIQPNNRIFGIAELSEAAGEKLAAQLTEQGLKTAYAAGTLHIAPDEESLAAAKESAATLAPHLAAEDKPGVRIIGRPSAMIANYRPLFDTGFALLQAQMKSTGGPDGDAAAETIEVLANAYLSLAGRVERVEADIEPSAAGLSISKRITFDEPTRALFGSLNTASLDPLVALLPADGAIRVASRAPVEGLNNLMLAVLSEAVTDEKKFAAIRDTIAASSAVYARVDDRMAMSMGGTAQDMVIIVGLKEGTDASGFAREYVEAVASADKLAAAFTPMVVQTTHTLELDASEHNGVAIHRVTMKSQVADLPATSDIVFQYAGVEGLIVGAAEPRRISTIIDAATGGNVPQAAPLESAARFDGATAVAVADINLAVLVRDTLSAAAPAASFPSRDDALKVPAMVFAIHPGDKGLHSQAFLPAAALRAVGEYGEAMSKAARPESAPAPGD